MHEMRVFLHGEHIQGSPTSINVLPAAAGVAQCELVPPEGVDCLPAGDLEAPSTALIKTRDKFGNACITGGLRIAGRLNLVKQSSTDNTILMPNNHIVTIEDNEVRRLHTPPPLPLATPFLLSSLPCTPLRPQAPSFSPIAPPALARTAPTSSTWRR